MRDITVNTLEGIKTEHIYNTHELSYLGKLFNSADSHKKDIHYLEIPCAFDIETTNIKDDTLYIERDTEIAEIIRKFKFYYDDNLKADIADFDHLRKLYFNQIHFSKTKGRPIDSIYNELHELRPYLFSDDILNTSDQLLKIIEVYDQNKKLKKSDKRPYAFMYHWQFCFDDQVVFGRTWQEFKRLLNSLECNLNLNTKNRLVIYVHNLPFEFQFMRRFLDIEDGFYMEVRKPLKVLLKNGIEFRDSLALSNMSLAKFCENEGAIYYKKDGETFDYSKLRTPKYKLTPYEEDYCYCDVRGLCECIKSRMKEYSLANIPLTSTGYVRINCRGAMKKNRKNRELFKSLALSPDLYKMCREAFRGGDTHANFKYSNKLLTHIGSFDIASSYPASMLIDKYPMTAFRKITLDTFYKLDFDKDAVLLTITLENPCYKGEGMPYIPVSKCRNLSASRVEDNGRILKAKHLTMTITEIDYRIIMKEYSFSNIYYDENRIFAAKKDYLPKELREEIMKYYKLKTELKHVKGKEYEYNRAKAMLNSIYGMMVMRIDQSEVTYDGEYHEVIPDLGESLKKYYKSRNNFLAYQWGVWVTANSRKRLRDMLTVIGKDAVYVDTDSIKCINDHKADFELKNKELIEEAKKMGAYAYNKDNVCFYIGIWDYEGTYDLFKTLGAKKYITFNALEDKVESTIAGVNKKIGAAFFKERGFDAFSNGTIIENSGHLVAYYNDNDIYSLTIDGERIETASNIALIDDTYTIGLTDNYMELLSKAEQNIADIEYI